MQLTPYLSFNGNCEAAFNFYEKALGGKITFSMKYGQAPPGEHAPLPSWSDKIMHVTLALDGQNLQGADAPPDQFHKAQGISIALNIKSVEEAERVFKALSEGATVQMPLEKTFWAERFGVLTDQFGTPWMINCEAAA